MPRQPPPILKLFLTGSARISGLTQKDTKTEIRLKTENYHPCERMRERNDSRYEQIETSLETIDQE